jgi:hypothetical protein
MHNILCHRKLHIAAPRDSLVLGATARFATLGVDGGGAVISVGTAAVRDRALVLADSLALCPTRHSSPFLPVGRTSASWRGSE